MSDSIIKLTSEFDPAIAGLDYNDNVVTYSIEGILEVLIIKQDLSMEDALEYFCFNMGNARGEGLPRYIWTKELDDLVEEQGNKIGDSISPCDGVHAPYKGNAPLINDK